MGCTRSRRGWTQSLGIVPDRSDGADQAEDERTSLASSHAKMASLALKRFTMVSAYFM